MPGIGHGIGIPFARKGFQWSTYWATLISATVETAAPTHVVLTFPTAQTSLGAADFTIAGFTIASASWTGAVLTLVLSEAVIVFDGNLTITFVITGQTATVTNNVADDGKTFAWYDFTSGVTYDVNNFVSRWNDKLGGGIDLLQATDGVKPVIQADSIYFPGDDEWMKTGAFTTKTQPLSIYLLIKQKVWSSNQYIIDGNTDGSAGVLQGSVTPRIRSVKYNLSGENADLAVGVWGIVRVVWDGASSTLTVNEGTPVTWTSADGITAITMGGRGASHNQNADFYIKQAIFRTDGNSDAVYNALKKKLTA